MSALQKMVPIKAHSRHVILVLHVLGSFTLKGCCITRSSCAEVLQTFHEPKKSYYGTPLKANVLTTNCKRSCEIFDPRTHKFRKTRKVNIRVHNGCAPSPINMPIKQMLPPANPFVLDWDHSYVAVSRITQFLRA